jgi:hypothetical protein
LVYPYAVAAGRWTPEVRDAIKLADGSVLQIESLPMELRQIYRTAYGARNPFAFMELQDVQGLTNFFERKVSAYQVAVQGEVAFDHAF